MFWGGFFSNFMIGLYKFKVSFNGGSAFMTGGEDSTDERRKTGIQLPSLNRYIAWSIRAGERPFLFYIPFFCFNHTGGTGHWLYRTSAAIGKKRVTIYDAP